MASQILARDPGYRFLKDDCRVKTLQGWSADIEKIHRIDEREWTQIWDVVKWCTKDQFWSTNILSGKKLRDKFDDLVLKMPASTEDQNNHGSVYGGKRPI